MTVGGGTPAVGFWVGVPVGLYVTGSGVGCPDGVPVAGLSVGFNVGGEVFGLRVVGAPVGSCGTSHADITLVDSKAFVLTRSFLIFTTHLARLIGRRWRCRGSGWQR